MKIAPWEPRRAAVAGRPVDPDGPLFPLAGFKRGQLDPDLVTRKPAKLAFPVESAWDRGRLTKSARAVDESTRSDYD